ncbi:carbonic anhydrase-related protein 10-like isoform X2 [Panulirus ornatus]|uniref:carbonic anhydrase-related protein 10-like isoform X2 n=1 Tax=Panulirus ornatus TaxID=150431 RepID=UPI003A865670
MRASRGSSIFSILVTLLFLDLAAGLGVSWDWHRWWTYDGISGPQFWGLINPEWSLCTNGRRQSPINLDPSLLLYDPNLRPLHIDKHRVSGVVNNTGHSVVFTVDEETEDPPLPGGVGGLVSVGGVAGSLNVGSSLGRVMGGGDGLRVSVPEDFDGVYHHRGHTRKNPPLNITGGPLSYRYRVGQVQLHFGSKDYMGSEHTVNGTSFPAEIQIYGYNSQLFQNFSDAVSRAHGIVAICIMIQLHALRKLHQGTKKTPKARMVNNFRPTQQMYHRPVRTNIDFTNSRHLNCPSMARQMYYTANTWR